MQEILGQLSDAKQQDEQKAQTITKLKVQLKKLTDAVESSKAAVALGLGMVSGADRWATTAIPARPFVVRGDFSAATVATVVPMVGIETAMMVDPLSGALIAKSAKRG